MIFTEYCRSAKTESVASEMYLPFAGMSYTLKKFALHANQGFGRLSFQLIQEDYSHHKNVCIQERDLAMQGQIDVFSLSVYFVL